MYKLIIFDLDGVITDTAEYHYLAWKELSSSIGLHMDREFNEQLKGVSRMESLERILKYNNLSSKYTERSRQKLIDDKNDYYVSLIKNITPKDILPGIIESLNWLKNKQLIIAIGSASRNAPKILEGLGISGYFDYVVNPDSVKRGKPEPDLFLQAANYYNIKAEECIVVEDALSGVQAAKAANMYVIGVGDKETLVDSNQVVQTTDLLLGVFQKLIC